MPATGTYSLARPSSGGSRGGGTAARRRATPSRPRPRPAPRRPSGGGGGSRSNRGYSPPSRAPHATGRARGAASSGGRGGGRAAAPRRPRYAGPPPPSAEMINQLYTQMGDIKRKRGQTNADYNFGRSQLFQGRDLFMRQLADTYRQRQQGLAADYANRGLSQSGLLNEALANLGKEQAGERGAYESDLQSQIASLLRQTTQTNAGLNAQGSALTDRFNKARADRARILQLMGG